VGKHWFSKGEGKPIKWRSSEIKGVVSVSIDILVRRKILTSNFSTKWLTLGKLTSPSSLSLALSMKNRTSLKLTKGVEGANHPHERPFAYEQKC